MSVLPAYKHFKLILGVTFDYGWRYCQGNSSSSTPIDLTNLSASWVLADPATLLPLVTYTNAVSPGFSGVFFGGGNADLTNGIVHLVIDSTDTAAITWKVVEYTLTFTDTSNPPIVTMPLKGTVTIIGTVL